MQFGLEKCAKVTCKKGLPVKSKNITLDINPEITELEHNKTYEYLGIDQSNGINYTMNKEKIRKEFYRRIRAIIIRKLNAKIKL